MAKKFLIVFALLLFPVYGHAQAVAPVTQKRATINVGALFSYGQTDYGQRHAFGPGFYGDFNYRFWNNLGVGVEGEARFMNWLTDSSSGKGISLQNFVGGPRVTYTVGRRWLPYAKFLVGGSRFHYPTFISNKSYNYTTYVYGGGLDIHLTDRWTLRPADFEHQHLDFPPTGLTPWAYSAGVSYRLF